MERPSGGLDGIGSHRHAPSLGDDDRIHTSALCRTGDSTEVTHISKPIQEDNEGRASFFVEHRDELIQLRVLDLADEGDDPLMLLACQTRQALLGDDLHRDRALLGHIHDMAHFAATQSALE